VDIGHAAARSVDWSAFQPMKGDASQFGDKLVNFLRSGNPDECREAWRHNAIYRRWPVDIDRFGSPWQARRDSAIQGLDQDLGRK
jgi:hypothetical protein